MAQSTFPRAGFSKTKMRRFSKWVDRLLHRRQAEHELDHEVAAYVDLLTEEKMRAGMTAAEARRAALLEVDGPTQVKEQVREAHAGATLEQIFTDLSYGWRLLRKNPGFAAVAMLTLALGIGANTAIFSVLYGVLLKPLPYSRPEEIVRVWQASHAIGFDQLGLTEGQFVTLRGQKRFFSEIGAYQLNRGFINNGEDTENVFLTTASAGVLEALGVQPLLGRGFQTQDEVDGSAPVAIISYELWNRWYGGSEQVLGKTIRVDDKLMTIVGVLPRGFFLPEDFVGTEFIQVWTPRKINSASPQWISYNLQPVARLRPGMTAQQAQAELHPYLEQLYNEHPIPGNSLHSLGWDVNVKNVHDDLVGGVKNALLVLACAVGMVLLIVCANVASLMLARSAARQKEIAVRVALGAQGIRIVRQLLTESLLIAMLGGTAGLLLAHWGLKLIIGLSAYNVPRLDQVSVNLPALLFTLAVSLGAGIIFGLFPALRAARPNLTSSLGQEGRGTSQGRDKNRAQSTLVVVEVASAVVLVVAAGLLLRSFERMVRVDPGFRTAGVLTLGIALPPARYPDSSQVAAFNDQALAHVRALPGVTEVAATSNPPLSGAGSDTVFDMEGQTTAVNMQQHLYIWQITPEYFATMGIPLINGRGLLDSDAAGRAPVVVINDAMARQFWNGRNPVGQHIRLYSNEKTKSGWLEIVGVVKNAPMRQLTEETLPEVFMTYAQAKQMTPWVMGTNLVIRTAQDPRLLFNAVREQVRSIDSSAVLQPPQTGDDLINRTVLQPHFNVVLLGLFAGVALALAVVGIYGILANMVRQRTREIGIRLALGAQRADVFRLVVGQGMRLAAIGVAVGMVLALLTSRLLRGLLFGVTPTDPITFTAVIALLCAAAFVACYVPARKATRVDPMITLRYE
jgi:putative ABC transport system permease protein